MRSAPRSNLDADLDRTPIEPERTAMTQTAAQRRRATKRTNRAFNPREPGTPRLVREKADHLTWGEIVQKPAKSELKLRTGEFYELQRLRPIIEVEMPEGYRGGRRPERANLAYSRALAYRLGIAGHRRREDSHPQRRKQRNAARVARAQHKLQNGAQAA